MYARLGRFFAYINNTNQRDPSRLQHEAFLSTDSPSRISSTLLNMVSITLLAFVSLLVSKAVLAHDGSCTNPVVRKEWRQMPREERADWIEAVKCLSRMPHDPALAPSVDPSISVIPPVNTSSSYYDDFVYMHMDLNVKIHFTGLFLPWHRWYVAVYEQALKEKCGYTGTAPYWDWSLDASTLPAASIFEENDRKAGLGGFGVPSKDITVKTGAFASGFELAYPVPHALRRNWTAQPWLGDNLIPGIGPLFTQPDKFANVTITPAEVSKMVNGFVGDFKGFQAYFEAWEGAHGAVHLMMGGDMGGTCPENAPANCTGGPKWSANEPMFWLHHGMVDKVWYDWQRANTQNGNIYFGGSVEAIDSPEDYNRYPTGGPPFLNLSSKMPADGLFPEASIGDVISTTEGMLCYVYE